MNPMSASTIDARANELRMCATRRWLVKDEIVFLLLHHRQQNAIPCHHKLQPRPQSGTLLFYDVHDVPDYKKDGWKWQKRKDNSGRVREDRAKLVINREVIILGTYVHSAETPTFHRRNYYLRDTTDSVMLVHYFDEVFKTDPTMAALVPAAIAPPSTWLLPQKGFKRTLPSSPQPSNGVHFLNFQSSPSVQQTPLPLPLALPPPIKMDPYDTRQSMDTMMRDCFDMDFQAPTHHISMEDSTPQPPPSSLPNFENDDDDDDALFSDLSNLLESASTAVSSSHPSHQHHQSATHGSSFSTSSSSASPFFSSIPSSSTSLPPLLTPLVQISDFSPDWDFTMGGAKILLCLASPLPASIVASTSTSASKLFVQFGSQARVAAECLSDTVLRCSAPACTVPQAVDLFVCFGSSASSTDVRQLSSRGRFQYKAASPSPAPPVPSTPPPRRNLTWTDENVPGPGTIAGSTNNGSATKRSRSPTSRSNGSHHHPNDPSQQNSRRSFPEASGTTRRRSFPDCINLSAFVDTDLDERQCKIRVVERFTEFQDAIRTTSTTTTTQPTAAAADDRLAHYGDAGPAATSVQTPSPAVSSLPLAAHIHSPPPPSAGSSLPYPAALDDHAIEVLSDLDLERLSEQLIEDVVRQLVTVAHGSDELLEELNSLDETGLSLLHYVSFYNYSQLIPLLLSHGAQVNQQSTQGATPLHLAAGCGHDQVVQQLLQQHDVDLFALDFDGLTAAERADKSGHPLVAQKLRTLMENTWTPSMIDSSMEMEISNINGGSGDDLWASTSGGGGMATYEDMDVDEDDVRGADDAASASSFALSPHQEAAVAVVLTGPTDATNDLDHPTTGSSFSSPSLTSVSRSSASYADDNQEHNRKLLLGAFSTMSLHDKCALSLSISRDLTSSSSSPAATAGATSSSLAKRRGSSISEDSVAALLISGSSSASSPSKQQHTDGLLFTSVSTTTSTTPPTALSENDTSSSSCDADVKSVIADDEANMYKLEAAMELMGAEELQSLEEEARVIQHNVRAWLLRRNCRHMRETTKRLHEAARSIEDQQNYIFHHEQERQMQAAERELMSQQELSQRERAAVTVQAAARSMLARKSFLQTRNVTIKVQAATRGVLCRKNFARMKTHALASLVIQRNVREWLSKQPTGASGSAAMDLMSASQDDTTMDRNGSFVGVASPSPPPPSSSSRIAAATTTTTSAAARMLLLTDDDEEERIVRELHAALDTVEPFRLGS